MKTKNSTPAAEKKEKARMAYVEGADRPSVSEVARKYGCSPPYLRAWAATGKDDPVGANRPWSKQRDDYWARVNIDATADRAKRQAVEGNDKDDSVLDDLRAAIREQAKRIVRLSKRESDDPEKEAMLSKAIETMAKALRDSGETLHRVRTLGIDPAELLRLLGGEGEKKDE